MYFISTDQEEKSIVGELRQLSYTGGFIDTDPLNFNQSNYGTLAIDSQPNAAVSDWWETPVGGDSGSPLMIVLDGELVLMSQWSTASTGPNFTQERNWNDVNRLMLGADTDAGISTGYQITPFDMYNYTSYVGGTTG